MSSRNRTVRLARVSFALLMIALIPGASRATDRPAPFTPEERDEIFRRFDSVRAPKRAATFEEIEAIGTTERSVVISPDPSEPGPGEPARLCLRT